MDKPNIPMTSETLIVAVGGVLWNLPSFLKDGFEERLEERRKAGEFGDSKIKSIRMGKWTQPIQVFFQDAGTEIYWIGNFSRQDERLLNTWPSTRPNSQ